MDFIHVFGERTRRHVEGCKVYGSYKFQAWAKTAPASLALNLLFPCLRHVRSTSLHLLHLSNRVVDDGAPPIHPFVINFNLCAQICSFARQARRSWLWPYHLHFNLLLIRRVRRHVTILFPLVV